MMNVLAAQPVLRNATPFDARRQARSLFWRGWGVSQISAELEILGVRNDKGEVFPRATIESWKQRDRWDDAPMIARMEDCLLVRFQVLVLKEAKTGADFKEIDLLGRQIERLARVRRYEEPGGHEGDLNDNVGNRNAGPRKKPKSNHFTAEQAAELRRLFLDGLYGYQETWHAALSFRTRMILKSRQIGATYYFAFEALLDAVETGDNQIFLSASKAQAFIFRTYMVAFAKLVGVTLKGGTGDEPMRITSDLIPETQADAEISFLGTNYRTAQGRHGHLYFDEFFWTHGFEELNKVASAMATHKRWRKTYFSTPSTIAHEAYPFWTGERRNRRKKKADRIDIDVTHAALKDGALCADRIWRHIVTVDDAEAQGCDLFDIEELKDEYAPDEFANLFLCQFVDDSLSAFRFNELLACGVDSLLTWRDFEPLSRRPAGNRGVWAGYDPQESEDGDNAALVIAEPPAGPDGKFRVLERHQLRGLDFEQQAIFIRSILAKYNCTYLGIDATGIGSAVYQLLAKVGPNGEPPVRGLTKIEYSIEVKASMVMKAQHTFSRGRIEFELSWVDLISSFISIKKTLTQSGRSLTFKAGRGRDTGHADIAWALMHILANEPLDGKPRATATMELC